MRRWCARALLSLKCLDAVMQHAGLRDQIVNLREGGAALCSLCAVRAFERESISSVGDGQAIACFHELVMSCCHVGVAHREFRSSRAVGGCGQPLAVTATR